MKWEDLGDAERNAALGGLLWMLAETRAKIDKGPPGADALSVLTERNVYHVLSGWDRLWDGHAGLLAAIEKLGGSPTMREKYDPLDTSKRVIPAHVSHVPERDGQNAQWRTDPVNPNHNLARFLPWRDLHG